MLKSSSRVVGHEASETPGGEDEAPVSEEALWQGKPSPTGSSDALHPAAPGAPRCGIKTPQWGEALWLSVTKPLIPPLPSAWGSPRPSWKTRTVL